MSYRDRMFATKPEYYKENVRRASQIRATPGLVTKPDGGTEPAVIIFNGHGFQYALDETQAYRLANSIADALQTHRHNTRTSTP